MKTAKKPFRAAALVNKNAIFSALLLLVSLLILVRITPVSVDPVVNLSISKSRTTITHIHQVRDIENTREVMVDRLNLIHKGRFAHPKLGNLAVYTDDFFVDINHTIEVRESDNYRFLIGSDDGFSFSVNGKPVCEHVNDRPYSIQSCMVFLDKGKHQVALSYFQGFGNSGFSVQYARGTKKPEWFGDDSEDIRF